jgi:hypothetical protein
MVIPAITLANGFSMFDQGSSLERIRLEKIKVQEAAREQAPDSA